MNDLYEIKLFKNHSWKNSYLIKKKKKKGIEKMISLTDIEAMKKYSQKNPNN